LPPLAKALVFAIAIALAALAAAVYSLQPRHVVIITSGPA
jgi:hypothetical protein